MGSEMCIRDRNLYVPQNSEEVEQKFFDVLQEYGACFEIEDFDDCVTPEIVRHTILITAV